MSYMEMMEKRQDEQNAAKNHFAQQFETQIRNLEYRWQNVNPRMYLDLKFTLDFKWELYINGNKGYYRLFGEVPTGLLLVMIEQELIVRSLAELQDISNRLT